MNKGIEIQDIYSLSPMQECIFYNTLIENQTELYFEQMIYTVDGDIDLEIFQKSFNLLIDRHDTLRTIFVHKNITKPKQVVCKGRTSVVNFYNIQSLNEKDKERYIDDFIKEDKSKGFNLTKDVLMRAAIIQVQRHQYKIFWSYHHIIIDGWSIGIIMREFFDIYRNILKNQPISLEHTQPYANYITWLQKKEKQEQLNYWKEYLNGYEQTASILGKSNVLGGNQYIQKELNVKFDELITNQIVKAANVNKVTVNILLQTLWGILLQKYNNTNDVVFGTVISGRTPDVDGIENIVGLFINTIPLRIKQCDEFSFFDYVRKVQNEFGTLEDNGYMSLAEIQSQTALKQNLIDHIIIFQNYPLDKKLSSLHEGNELKFTLKDIKVFERTNYNFNIMIIPGKTLEIKFIYNEAIYDSSYVRKVGEQLRVAVKDVLHNNSILVKNINILPQNEKIKVLHEFNNTSVSFPYNKTIPQVFEEQVKNTPDALAVIYGNNQLSYQELNIKSNQLANRLRQVGVKAEAIVAVMLERSFDMMIGVMGILKAGGAYLPIDPFYPEKRKSYVLEDSGAKVLLTTKSYMLPSGFEGSVIYLDEDHSYIGNGENLEITCAPENAAYIIYTSGSTGIPKGVIIEHKSVINRLNWMQRRYPLKSEDIILQKTPYTFDVSVWELFWWFFGGAKVCFLSPGGEKDPREIVETIQSKKITIMHFVPSMLSVFLEYMEDEANIKKVCSVRRVFASGEALTVGHVKKFNMMLYKNNATTLHNLYGPTEATVDVSYFDCINVKEINSIPIGKPIDNNKLYVLGRNLELAPIGVQGELYISGIGVGRGYLNKTELTCERFINNTFVHGERMYKTGDLARWLPDGNIEYLGRIDQQVKIRGNRIELGEVENGVLNYEDIRDAVVIDRIDKQGNKYLCCYIVANKKVDVNKLRAYLQNSLLDYMIPSCIIQLDSLPLNSNGKIDRKLLPEPNIDTQISNQFVAPRNETEEKLLKIWQHVLDISRISVQDNFFNIGGHSLKATSVMLSIAKEFNVELKLSEIFDNPTIEGLARRINLEASSILDSIEMAETKEYYTLSSAQKRIYVLNTLEEANTSYNIPSALIYKGKLKPKQIEEIINKLIERHESLRTSFELINGVPMQKINASVKCNVESVVCDDSEVDEVVRNFVRAFDLSKPPLIRVGIVNLRNENTIVLLDIHHIIADGVSMNILMKEFVQLFKGNELHPLSIQYKDFAEWQNRKLHDKKITIQGNYWRSVLSGEIPLLNFPLDYERPSFQSFEGDRITLRLDKKLVQKLYDYTSETSSTVYMVLLATYDILLSKYTGQEDIIVGSPIAGRRHHSVENIVGMFVNTLPMRNYPKGSVTFHEFLDNVKTNVIKAYDNQDYQFEDLMDMLDIKRDLSRNPLFDAMFFMHEKHTEFIDVEDGVFKQYPIGGNTSKVDILLEALRYDESLELSFEYCTKIIKKATIEQFAQHFINILNQVLDNEYIKLSEIELMSQEEKKKVIYDFNATEQVYHIDKTINLLFEAQVDKTPENIALKMGNSVLTYRELNEKVNQVARTLRKNGVKPNTIVAIMTSRCFDMIIGILGILKAGGAYLPVDPEFPMDRIQYVLEDSGANILLTQRELKVKITFDDYHVLYIDNPDNYSEDMSNLSIVNSPLDLAYVIYTSGSTGKPKGIMIQHRPVVNFIHAMSMQIEFTQGKSVLALTTVSFDIFVLETLMALVKGLKIVIADEDHQNDIKGLCSLISNEKIELLQITPSRMKLIMNEPETAACLETIKDIIVGGEAFPDGLAEEIHKVTNVRLYNAYGPTEATVWTTVKQMTKGKITIGKPIANTQIYIMDRYDTPLPIGIPGELCIAGEGLAKGYLNNFKLTDEKFVPNPFADDKNGISSEKRMYRTGDLARWLPNGEIEFLGRIDHQVKIRGYRIELGEIESQLLTNHQVKEAVVVDRKGADGNKYLCAYIVQEEEVTVTQLREHLSKTLPGYMIPSYFFLVKKLPLTPNGKIDRSALKMIEENMKIGVEYIAPRDAKEKILVEVWKDILKIDKIGIDDSFFDLGGDSIKAVQVAAKLTKYKLPVSIKDIFHKETIRELCESMQITTEKSDNDIVEGEVPLTPMQLMLLKYDVANVNKHNQAVMLYRKEGFDESILRETFSKLVQHHDALRMMYSFKEDNVIQFNRGCDGELFILNVFDVYNDDEYRLRIDKEVNKIQEDYRLTDVPLVKLALFKTDVGDYLTIVIHQLLVDDVSWKLILKDFKEVYMSAMGGKTITLPNETESFKNWSLQIRKFAASEGLDIEKLYWGSLKNNKISKLSKKKSISERKVKNAIHLGFTLTLEETEDLLKNIHKTYNTNITDILIAALSITMEKCIDGQKILVNMENYNRSGLYNFLDVHETVGCFGSICPICLDLNNEQDIGDVVKSTKELLRHIPNNGIGYEMFLYSGGIKTEDIVEPEISFHYFGQYDWINELFDMSASAKQMKINNEANRRHALDINAIVKNDRLEISFVYDKWEFDENFILKVVEDYKDALSIIRSHCLSKEDREITPSDLEYKNISMEELGYLDDMINL